MRLQDRTAIVTGSGRGIGKAIAMKLAAEGAKVAVADIDEESASATAAEIREQGSEALAVKADVTDLAAVEAMIEKVHKAFGRIDVLVNNAGWDKVEPFLKNSPDDWDRVISINLKGVIHMSRTVLPLMIENGYGKIVNIGSDAGRVGSTGEAVYSATKGGIIAFSKTIAREMAKHHINVNVVCPGPAKTALFQKVVKDNPKLGTALEKAIPFRRLAEPDDIANAVCFFASDEASYVTGQTLSVSGGLTMA
ncbi:MAG TPA: SDR family NAD(P)-dependent oxidoreductase [Bacillales bacterium]|nr:SDR family NAD(P)-dependent oxidoreductase [Bacillales bacterium]